MSLLDTFPEINFANYGEDEVKALQDWAFEALDFIKEAEQHQGEPVAYLCKVEGAKWLQYGSKVGDPWKPGEVQVTPLYPHADPGEIDRLESLLRASRTSLDNCALQIENLQNQLSEVERLRGIIRMHEKTVQEQADHLAYMRAQLAERDALLRAWLDMFAGGLKASPLELLESRTLAALSASAEPSAQVERDERAAFEADWARRKKVEGCRERANAFYRIQPNDRYRWNDVQDGWDAWQARAALDRKP